VAELRVGFDATSLDVHGKGVARYVRELLPQLARIDSPLEIVALAAPGAELPAGAERVPVERVRARPATLWEQVGVRQAVRRRRLALVHTTTDRLPLGARFPVVVYLFEDPKYRLEAQGRRSARKALADTLTASLFPLSLRSAALVLVSSRATARDLEQRGILAERVRLVYPGVSDAFHPAAGDAERSEAGSRNGAPGGYVLHFSSDDPRDNTAVVLEAYAELRRRLPSAPALLVAGPVRQELGPQRAHASELALGETVKWLGPLSGPALSEIYRGASAYVDPSRYEGFGFQVAEALASGVPVVCSGVTSLPEVVGKAGILAPPDDVRAFANGLEAVLTDADLAARLRREGPEQASQFDWARTARETVAAWADVLRGAR
jgi:glycosyltransferase involved in cell wall biosynthesis